MNSVSVMDKPHSEKPQSGQSEKNVAAIGEGSFPTRYRLSKSLNLTITTVEWKSVKLLDHFQGDSFILEQMRFSDQALFELSSRCSRYNTLIWRFANSAQIHKHERNRRDGVVVRASASQSADLGLISLVKSYKKILKNGIHSFPAWRSAQKRDSVENKPPSLLVMSLGKALKGTPPPLCGKQVAHPYFTGLQLRNCLPSI